MLVAMKKLIPLLALVFTFAVESGADDRVRDVQSQLKTQGFYYGEINGKNSAETSAALRRYQIRNGLEVTGTLTEETVKALGIGVAPSPQPPVEARPQPAQPAAPSEPPPPPRRAQSLENSDKSFLRREEAKERGAQPVEPLQDDPSVVAPPRSMNVPSPDLPVIFADTPYANAPAEIQESMLRKAQTFLAGRGFYREPIDGEPGPATEEAILSFQRRSHLPLTGRLDLETLNVMRLLPGRAPVPSGGFVPEPSGRQVFRGIWIR
jgi:peptidoglycan hydrolase-like protein with peptidoglycan-binding domain